jgi:diguanylate cyclase (GGDEF)-like protein
MSSILLVLQRAPASARCNRPLPDLNVAVDLPTHGSVDVDAGMQRAGPRPVGTSQYAEVMQQLIRVNAPGSAMITLLILVSVWGDWRKVLIVLGIEAVHLPFNMWVTLVGLRRWDPMRAESVRALVALTTIVVMGLLTDWPLPLWFRLPFAAMAFDQLGASRPGYRTTLAFCIVVGGVALADGVHWSLPLFFTGMAMFCGQMSHVRMQVIRGMLDRSFAQRSELLVAHESLRGANEQLALAHADAVVLSSFGEHVQQLTSEDELHATLAAHLRSRPVVGELHTIMRNPSQSRLDLAVSTTGIERTRLPILSDPMTCRAVRTLKPVSADAGSPTACRCDLVPAAGSHLCTPMLAAGELVGVVNLQAAKPGAFDDAERQRVQGFLGFASTALASIRLLAATRDRALRDPLTGAYNRAFLDEFLGKQLLLAERRHATLAVLMVDLDHFKRLNDSFGHAVGDRALVAAVGALQRSVRSSDAVVRYGGEELAVVLVDTDVDGAVDAAERARRAIADVVLPTDKGPVGVRASIGVAAYPRHGADQAGLFAAADEALYRAKAQGRDRVVAAEETN